MENNFLKETVSLHIETFDNDAYVTAVKNGFYDDDSLPTSHHVMMMITELSEAIDAHRKGQDDDVLEELADYIIRGGSLLRHLGFYGEVVCTDDWEWASLTSMAFYCTKLLHNGQIGDSMVVVYAYALKKLNADLMPIIKNKIDKNGNRGHLHGKLY